MARRSKHNAPWTPRQRAALRRRLLDWYRASARTLPWRGTGDPYRIWLSEAMLQQTRVETVIPYYERFLARFPTLAALASADEQDVLRQWAGLGYYSRARNLHRAARAALERHGGRLPRELEELRSLPGVGPYTAAAVASIAFDQPHAVLDGNVKRVLVRLTADRRPHDDSALVAELWGLADALLDRDAPGDFNQAMMELGATVCAPRAPECNACPIRSMCAAARDGVQESIPTAKRRRSVPRVHRAAAALRRADGAYLFVRRPERGLLGGMWCLPDVECPSDDVGVLRSHLRDLLHVAPRIGGVLGRVEHVFTHRRMTLTIRRASAARPRNTAANLRWLPLFAVRELPLARIDLKAIALLTKADQIAGAET